MLKYNVYIFFFISIVLISGCVSQPQPENAQNFNNSSIRQTNHLSNTSPIQTSFTKTNSYLGTPCEPNHNLKFPNDITDSGKILKITPTSLIASKMQDRAWLWIDTSKTNKVPIYSPVDADLVRGVYKISKSINTIDYDLHFQVSCEVWFYINHISDPVEKIKTVFPDKPANNTSILTQINPPIHFKAGDLIGYTTGTYQAHNFDFAVFDLNHTNNLIGDAQNLDPRFKNFICPFDVFPSNLKDIYYKKLDPQLISESNCEDKG